MWSVKLSIITMWDTNKLFSLLSPGDHPWIRGQTLTSIIPGVEESREMWNEKPSKITGFSACCFLTPTPDTHTHTHTHTVSQSLCLSVSLSLSLPSGLSVPWDTILKFRPITLQWFLSIQVKGRVFHFNQKLEMITLKRGRHVKRKKKRPKASSLVPVS